MKLFHKLFLITIFTSFLIVLESNNIFPQFAYFAGGTGNDTGKSIAVDGSGNVYVTGRFNGTADFDPGAGTTNLTSTGDYDVLFAKYNSSGALVWAKNVGGTGNDIGESIAVDGSGNVYVTGTFFGTADFDPDAGTTNLTSAGSSNDVFFAKYNSSGALVWAKNVGGSSGDEIGYSIAVDGSANVYVTGRFYGTVDFDPNVGTTNLTSAGSNYDVFFAKYNSSGALVWAKSVGGSSWDEGRSIALDGSGNVYVTGDFNDTADFDPDAGTTNLTSAGVSEVFFAKYNSSGALLWAKSVRGPSYDDVYSIAVDGSGNVYVTGSFQGTADFDPDAGTTNLTSAGLTDVFLAKYNSSGALVGAKNIGGTSAADFGDGYSIAVDASGNVYVTGYFYGTADFDPGTGTTNLTSAGYGDVFFAKYNSTGSLVWAKSVGGTNDDYGYSIAVDGSGNVYVTGSFYDTVDFDPDAGTLNLTTAGGSDLFFAKYNSNGSLNISGVENEEGIPISYSLSQNFPNPFNPYTIIRYALPSESNVSIKVYNILGQKIKSLVNTIESAGYHEITFNANNLASGIYLYRIVTAATDGDKTFIDTKKLMLMK